MTTIETEYDYGSLEEQAKNICDGFSKVGITSNELQEITNQLSKVGCMDDFYLGILARRKRLPMRFLRKLFAD